MLFKKVVMCFVCLLLLFTFSSCNEKAKYKVKFDEVLKIIPSEISMCYTLCSGYSEIWQLAIENNVDFNEYLTKTRNSKDIKNTIKDIKDNKNKIENLMKELQNPPAEYKESYNILLELYIEYTHLESLAECPNGSLLSYNNDVSESVSKCMKLMEKLKVLSPKK